MAGYSPNSLQKKLGIKPDTHVAFFNAPANYWDLISPLPDHLHVIEKPKKEALDFIHLFVKEKKNFERDFIKCRNTLKKTGMMWVSWPKKASKVVTDLDENQIREFGLSNGLVDVKVCAVDEIWSGLKFVYRLADR